MKAAAVALALPALLAGCLAGQPAQAPVPTGQIDGAVLDHLLNPFADQPVLLVQLDRTDRTSALGGFTFREVPVGVYTLTTTLAAGATDTEIVEVRGGAITRIILQLTPTLPEAPTFQTYGYRSPGETAQAGTECEPCEWAVPLGAERPAEVTFEALWDGSLLGDHTDDLDITITDGRGFQLYDKRRVSSPLVAVAIDGADIHPEATELRVTVSYSAGFMPSTQDFSMRSVFTLYYGATKAEMFGVPT